MEVQAKESLVEFFGLLDEKTSLESIGKVVLESAARSKDASVRLDFSGVKRANSVGILAWAKFVDIANCHLIYINAPEWLVEQFNLCDLLKNGATVESLQAPFYCTETDIHETVTLYVGKDIPIQEDYSEFEIVRKNSEGVVLEADFEPPEYFHFISRNVQQFKEAIK